MLIGLFLLRNDPDSVQPKASNGGFQKPLSTGRWDTLLVVLPGSSCCMWTSSKYKCHCRCSLKMSGLEGPLCWPLCCGLPNNDGRYQFDFKLPLYTLFGQTHPQEIFAHKMQWCNSRSEADSDPLGPVSFLLDSVRLNQTCVQLQAR